MKKLMNYLSVVLFLGGLSLTACSSDKGDDPSPESPQNPIELPKPANPIELPTVNP